MGAGWREGICACFNWSMVQFLCCPLPVQAAWLTLPAASPCPCLPAGEMSDAAEVLLSLYERVMEAEARLGLPSQLISTVGLEVREEVHCGQCGKATHQASYTQYFYNTQVGRWREGEGGRSGCDWWLLFPQALPHLLSIDQPCHCLLPPLQAAALQLQQFVRGEDDSTGSLLREAEAQHRKSCDTDVGGCGALNSVNHFLQHAPRVFTLQVAWESHNEPPEAIATTLAALDEVVGFGWQQGLQQLHCRLTAPPLDTGHAQGQELCTLPQCCTPATAPLSPPAGRPGRGVPGGGAGGAPLPPAQHGVLLWAALPGAGAGARGGRLAHV